MSLLIRLCFYLSVLGTALAVGGASQRAFSSNVALLCLALGFGFGFLAFLLSVLLWLIKPGSSRGTFELPITGFLSILLGIVQALAVAYVYFLVYKPYPPINDVTTNLESPPEFQGKDGGLTTLEGEEFLSADNMGRVYDRGFIEKQKVGYPDIKSLTVEASPAVVYKAAVITINQFPSWQMGITQEDQFHVEAMEESDTFHIVDDIVVHIRPDGENRSIVEMRSRTRGVPFDTGRNAQRIREFFRKLEPAVIRAAAREKARLQEAAKAAEGTTPPPAAAPPQPPATPPAPPTSSPTNPVPPSATPTAAPPASMPPPAPAAMTPPSSNPVVKSLTGSAADAIE